MELILETAGESHGRVLTAILAGIPAGSPVTEAFVNARLAARQKGRGTSSRQQIERDEVTFLSGVRDGKATGNPIALQVPNRDDTYQHLPPVNEPRPGHADLPGALNRGLTDARDIVERASARETAVRVAAAAVCAEFLDALGITVLGHVASIADIDVHADPGDDLEAARARRAESEHHALGPADAQERAARAIDAAGGDGDTLGGVVEVVARNVPLGLGGHERPETKLKATLAATLMGVQAVQGVEIGLGFRGAGMRGSQLHDGIVPGDDGVPTREGNNAGGIEGGMSNGQPIVVRAAMKPLATLRKRLPSVDLTTGDVAPARHERSDVTAVSRLAVIAECVVAFDLARHVRRRFGGAHIDEVRESIARHQARMRATRGGGET